MRPPWKRLGQFLVVIWILSSLVRAWYNPSGAHGTRQVDTAGVSLALALDYQEEGYRAFLKTAFYPRVLQRGQSSGINTSEFPLLNLLTAPFFLLGPHSGNFLGCLFLLLLNVGAAIFFVPRLLNAWKIPMPLGLSPVLYFSIGCIAWQSNIFMPEGLALPLLVIGASLYCSGTYGKVTFSKAVGLVLLSLSVAVKPMAAVGFIPILAFPFFRQFWDLRKGLWFLGGLGIALIFPGWWYGIHMHQVALHVDGYQVFLKAEFSPFRRVTEVGLWGILKLIWRQCNSDSGQFAIFTGPVWVLTSLYYAPLLLGVLLISLAACVALAGVHLWEHFYYFFAAGLSSLLLIPHVLNRVKSRRIYALCMICILWGLVYGIRTNIWVTARTHAWWSFTEELRKTIPSDALLVTDDEGDATRLLFLGRKGTISASGVLEICHHPNYRDKKVVMLVSEPTFQLSKKRPGNCLDSATLLQTAKSDWTTWRLFQSRP